MPEFEHRPYLSELLISSSAPSTQLLPPATDPSAVQFTLQLSRVTDWAPQSFCSMTSVDLTTALTSSLTLSCNASTLRVMTLSIRLSATGTVT